MLPGSDELDKRMEMEDTADGISYISGSSGILVIAPHGPVIDGEYQNDIRTGLIARELHRELGCTAVINDRYFKPKGPVTKDPAPYFLDMFRVDHARKVPGYLKRIRETAATDGRTLVLWLHGIADDVAVTQGQLHIEQGLFDDAPENLHALIGYGQGGDPKTGDLQDRFSARPETVQAFAGYLSAAGMNTVPTWREGPNFRGRDGKRFNQWFGQQGYGFETVESMQLEIKEEGFRDYDASARAAASIIAAALKNLSGTG